MLTASLLSTVHGALLQRPGGLLVSQTLRWRLPVFAGDTLRAESQVVEVITARRRLRCRSTVTNQRDEVVLDGEAFLQKDPA